MTSPKETTPLLHPSRDEHVVRAVVDSVQQAEILTSVPICGEPSRDIEATQAAPSRDDAASSPKISTVSLIQVVAVLMIGRSVDHQRCIAVKY